MLLKMNSSVLDALNVFVILLLLLLSYYEYLMYGSSMYIFNNLSSSQLTNNNNILQLYFSGVITVALIYHRHKSPTTAEMLSLESFPMAAPTSALATARSIFSRK